jgi:co-chaperonin GroES (HSP10)
MSAKKLIPLLDRVLVERFVPPTKSLGGVLLPESTSNKVRARHGADSTAHPRPGRALPPGAADNHIHSIIPWWSRIPAHGLRARLPSSPHPPTAAAAAPPLQVNQGTVLAVGPGRRSTTGELIPVAVKEGDKVLLPEYGGTQVKLDDKEE